MREEVLNTDAGLNWLLFVSSTGIAGVNGQGRIFGARICHGGTARLTSALLYYVYCIIVTVIHCI